MPPTSLVWLRNCHFRLKKTTCAPAKKKKKNRCTQEFILSVYFLSSQPWTLPFFFLSLSGYSRHPGYRGSASITSASFWELKSSRQLVAQSWIRMSFSKWTIFNQTFLWFPRARGPPPSQQDTAHTVHNTPGHWSTMGRKHGEVAWLSGPNCLCGFYPELKLGTHIHHCTWWDKAWG